MVEECVGSDPILRDKSLGVPVVNTAGSFNIIVIYACSLQGFIYQYYYFQFCTHPVALIVRYR